MYTPMCKALIGTCLAHNIYYNYYSTYTRKRLAKSRTLILLIAYHFEHGTNYGTKWNQLQINEAFVTNQPAMQMYIIIIVVYGGLPSTQRSLPR